MKISIVQSSMKYLLALLVLPLICAAQSADEIVARNIQARGGIERLKAIHSLQRSGTVTTGNGTLDLREVWERPDKLRRELFLAGSRQIEAYDGQSGWRIDGLNGGEEAEPLKSDDLLLFKRSTDFDGPLVDSKAKGIQVELQGQESIDGKPSYKLKLTYKEGDISYLYLDVQSFLETKRTGKIKLGGNETDYERRLSDYREVGGLMLPFTVETRYPDLHFTQTITVQKVELNMPVDRASFALPPRPKEDPEIISADKIAAENKWWKDLGATVPADGIVLPHPWAKPYSGRSLIVPRSILGRWFTLRSKSNPTISAAQLRADLPLLHLVMEKNYAGWEVAAEHGWNWDSWFKSWDSDLAKLGSADVPLEKAFAPWDDYERFQLDNHSGLPQEGASVRSRSAVLKEIVEGNCSRMKMQDGKSYPMAVNDPSQQPHNVYAWNGAAYSRAAYISYPANRGEIASVACAGKTFSASLFFGSPANDQEPVISPLTAAPEGTPERDPFYATLAPGIGYVRLPGFSEAQDEVFRKLVQKLPPEAGHEKAVIFDLRGNEGGAAPLENLGAWVPDHYIQLAGKVEQRVKGSCFLPGLRFGLLQLLTWRVEPPVSPSLLETINRDLSGLSASVPEGCPVSFEDNKADWTLSRHHFTPGMPASGTRIVLLVDSGCGSDCEYFTAVLASVPGSVIVGSSTYGLAGFTQPGFFYLPNSHVLFRVATSVTKPYGDSRTIDGYGLSADVILPSAASQARESMIRLIESLNSPPTSHQ